MEATVEASETGVLEFWELMFPYWGVAKSNRTMRQELLSGSVKQRLSPTPQRSLPAGS